MLEWGLCCIFRNEPIRFRRATATALQKLARREQLHLLSKIAQENADNLHSAFKTCIKLKIRAFRVNSELLPLATHPVVGYRVEDLDNAPEVLDTFAAAREYARTQRLRLSLHPDQFVVLNSPRRDVVDASLRELRHQARLAELCGAREINLHAGGGYGDKHAALLRLDHEIASLPPEIAGRLTLENDDRIFTPSDLIEHCLAHAIPLTYDVHHHRVNADALTVAEATEIAAESWRVRGVTPHFHISSPAIPWDSPGDHRPHADYIENGDIPACWSTRDLTVDVEAKAKELAVLRLQQNR